MVNSQQVLREVYDPDTKTLGTRSGATVFAVVNTAANGGNVTVEQGTSPWVTSFAGNVTIDSGTVSVDSNTAWADPKTYIGLVTVANTVATSFAGNVTLDPGSFTGIKGNVTVEQVDVVTTVGAVTDITNPIAIKGNLTIDQVDVVTAVTGITNPVAIKGNLTIEQVDVVTAVTSITNPVAIKGNVTLSNSKTFIGLATVVQSSAARSILGNITVDQVDVVTAVTDITNPVALKGNVTVEQVDLVTAVTDITNPVALKGNVTIANTSIDGPGAPVIDSITQASFNLTAAANQVLVASSANKQVWVYGIGFTLSVDGTVSFQDEDDATITGIMPFAANSGMALAPSGNFAMPLWKLGTDKDFEVDLVTAAMDGWVTYAIVSV